MEMRGLLKRTVYIVEASQFYAKIDNPVDGSYAGRSPLYPAWSGS